MADPEQAHLDTIVGGLTRPPMMLGIPYVLFVLEFTLVLLVFINTKNLLMFLLLIPIHGIAYWLTVKDARFVDVLVKRLARCPMTRNRQFWGGNSYAP